MATTIWGEDLRKYPDGTIEVVSVPIKLRDWWEDLPGLDDGAPTSGNAAEDQ